MSLTLYKPKQKIDMSKSCQKGSAEQFAANIDNQNKPENRYEHMLFQLKAIFQVCRAHTI